MSLSLFDGRMSQNNFMSLFSRHGGHVVLGYKKSLILYVNSLAKLLYWQRRISPIIINIRYYFNSCSQPLFRNFSVIGRTFRRRYTRRMDESFSLNFFILFFSHHSERCLLRQITSRIPFTSASQCVSGV